MGNQLRKTLHSGVDHFRRQMKNVMAQAKESILLVPSISAIQALVIPGNTRCSEFCERLLKKSNFQILLYPIRSPTVSKGQERVRLIIHAHNSKEQISMLVGLVWSTLKEMSLLRENEPGVAHYYSRL